MKRYALLLTTILFPASSHAATVNFGVLDVVAPHAEFMTIDATYSAPSFTSYSANCCGYSKVYTITQVDNNQAPIQSATFSLDLTVGSPGPEFYTFGWLPVIMRTGLSTATFTLVEGVNHFTTYTGVLSTSLGGTMTLTTTFHTPIPAALPLFAAGLGMIGWFTRKRPRYDWSDENHENAIW